MTSPRFERWRVDLPPGSERPTDATEWADALVTVEHGLVEVVCAGGGQRTFPEGSLLALCWLPVSCLRNPTTEMTTLLAIRRCRGPTAERGLPSEPS